MPTRCDACWSIRPDGARFCPTCGAPILAGVQPHLERKLITAVFIDVVGSTALAEHEDPEVVRAVVGHAFDLASREIARHGGYVEKFIGDAVLAVFGIPAIREDDAERAVRAAIGVRDALEADDRDASAAERPRIAVRIGVETGEILVDLDRVEGIGHRMLTGDAVNTAARLQQTAEPGQVVVGPVTYATTHDVIRYLDLPARELKGKHWPVDRWEAVEPQRRGSRLRLRARMVGRADELHTIVRTLDDVTVTRRPSLVAVVGPPGIGKSRLAYEAVRVVGSMSATVLRGRCPQSGGVSYSAFAQAMRSACGASPRDGPQEVRHKASSTVEALLGDALLAPHLAVLLGAGPGDAGSREELFDAWRRIVEGLAASSPLLMVLEDLHWADDGLLDLVEHIVTWGSGPLLLLTTARPDLLERRPAWCIDGSACRTVHLRPLPPGDVAAMLTDLLGGPAPTELARIVSERSEGNPLFGEELVRMMIDLGMLRATDDGRWELHGAIEDVAIPRSIQALIAARIDSLSADEKTLVQDAAVIGRTFRAGTLRRLADLDDDRVRRALDHLETKEFIVRRTPKGAIDDPEFTFHHAVIRDVAYGSLPKASRATKHEAVACGIEADPQSRTEDVAGAVAAHHLQALRWLDELGDRGSVRTEVERAAFTWSGLAADRCARLWEQPEAARWLRTALDLATRVDASIDDVARLWERYAHASDGLAPYEDVVRAWDEARTRYERLGDRASVGRIEASIANAAIWAGRFDAAGIHARRAVDRLRPLGESPEYALAMFALGRHALERDDLDEAEPLLRTAGEVALRQAEPIVQANATIALGWVLQARHDGPQAVELFDEALRIARRTGDLLVLLDALEAVFSAAIEIGGDYGRAMTLVDESITIAERSGNLAKLSRGHLNRGYLLRELGHLEEARAAVRAALDAARRVGDPLLLAYGTMVGALSSCSQGDLDGATRAFDTARGILAAEKIDGLMYWDEFDVLIDAYVAMGQARSDLAVDRLVSTCTTLADERLSVWMGQLLLFETIRALVVVHRRADALDVRTRLERLALDAVPPRAFLAWADGLLATRLDEARAHLVDAAARLEHLGRRLDLGRCLLDLADVERALGLDDRATRERGRSTLVELRALLFLERPPVPAPAGPAG